MCIRTQTLKTQGRFAGFNYPGIESGLRMAGINCDAELFQGLQQIENHIINFVLNKS